MANTIAGSNIAAISRAGFEAFKDMLAPISAFSTNFSDEVRQPSESVATRIFPSNSAASFSSDYTDSPDNVLTGVTVTLNQNRFTNFHITDTEQSKTPVDLMAGFAREAGYGLAKDIIDYTLGLVLAATYGDTANDKVTVSAAAFDVDDVIDGIEKALTNKKWGSGSIILNYAYAAALMKDNAIKDASAFGTAGSAAPIQSGRVGTLFGFPVYTYPVPGNSENLTGMIVNPASLAVAVRPMTAIAADGMGSTVSEVVTDADSGLSLGFRMFYEDESGRLFGAYHALYGASAAQSTGIVRIVSA